METSEIENFVMDLVFKSISNKKFIFLVISILFNNSMFKLCGFLISKVIEVVLKSTESLYSIEEISTLYRDNLKVRQNDDICSKMDILLQFHNFILIFIDQFNMQTLQDNFEWILIQIHTFYEKNLIVKNSKESLISNQIFEDISKRKSNHSYLITQLSDLILKKKLLGIK
jgi:hypothetical protein